MSAPSPSSPKPAMPSSPRTGSRFMRWLQRTPEAPRPATPDPADMGTCFGLEMSMSDEPQDPYGRAPRVAPPKGDGAAD